jgi:hypothetical protein
MLPKTEVGGGDCIVQVLLDKKSLCAKFAVKRAILARGCSAVVFDNGG